MSAFSSLFSIRADFHIAPFNKQFLYFIKQLLTDDPFMMMYDFVVPFLACLRILPDALNYHVPYVFLIL